MAQCKETSSKSKKIRKGDKVLIIAGNSRGFTGTILSCSEDKAIVQGLNMRKRHVKGGRDQKGDIITREAPIHISNLCLCDEQGERIKLHVEANKKGEREFYYMKDDKKVVYRAVKSPKK